MVARARKYEETGDMYADALRVEAQVMKFRLKGKWVWKTFYPIDSMENLPNNAIVLEKNKDGDMVRATVFDPKNKQHFIKLPPYRAPAKPDRTARKEMKRRMRGTHVTESEGVDTITTSEDNTGKQE